MDNSKREQLEAIRHYMSTITEIEEMKLAREIYNRILKDIELDDWQLEVVADYLKKV